MKVGGIQGRRWSLSGALGKFMSIFSALLFDGVRMRQLSAACEPRLNLLEISVCDKDRLPGYTFFGPLTIALNLRNNLGYPARVVRAPVREKPFNLDRMVIFTGDQMFSCRDLLLGGPMGSDCLPASKVESVKFISCFLGPVTRDFGHIEWPHNKETF